MAHGQYPVPVLHVYLRLTYLSTSTVYSIQSSFRMSYGFPVWIFLCPGTLNLVIVSLLLILLLIPMCQIGVSFLQLFANLFMTGVPIHSLAFTAAVKCTPTSTTFGDRFSHNPT